MSDPAPGPGGSSMVVSDRPPSRETTRLLLVRHGEATCNVEGVVGGVLGCRGLTGAGRVQAEALRNRLAATGEVVADALYASVLPRAVETAAIIAPALGPAVGTVPVAERRCDLCELHPGEADGLDWPTFEERFGNPGWSKDPSRPVAPGGESWSGFVERASVALAELAAKHEGHTVVVVCHAGVIESSMLRFYPCAPEVSRLELRTRHTSLTEWAHEDGRWLLLRYNDAAHLDWSAPWRR